jgi:3',5'-cyclic AMP phosphodiesterase CpdA
MFTLAHFSDVHLPPMPRPRVLELCNKRLFGYLNWQRRRVHHRRDVLDALVADVAKQDLSHIAITGDLTNIGLPEEFRLVRDWLMGIGGGDLVTVVPGNHDAYTPFSPDPGSAAGSRISAPMSRARRSWGRRRRDFPRCGCLATWR